MTKKTKRIKKRSDEEIERLKSVRDALKVVLKDHDWLMGIGIGFRSNDVDICVRVNVRDKEQVEIVKDVARVLGYASQVEVFVTGIIQKL